MDSKDKKNHTNEYSVSVSLAMAVKLHQGKIAQDEKTLKQIACNTLGCHVDWDGVTIARLLNSMQSKSADLVPGLVDQVVVERGHRPVEFLKSYFRCLMEVYVIFYKQRPDIAQIVEAELHTLDFLIFSSTHRRLKCEQGKSNEHIEWMESVFNKIIDRDNGSLIPYQIGVPGHTFYAMYYARNGLLFCMLHDVGGDDLSSSEDKSSSNLLVHPKVYRVDNVRQHLLDVLFAREYCLIQQDKTPLTEQRLLRLMTFVYSNLTLVGTLKDSRWAEKPQNTLNCVAKNFFHGMKIRMIIRTGLSSEAEMKQGEQVFNTIFLQSVEVLLSYKVYFDGGLGSADTLSTAQSLQDSMSSFSGENHPKKFTLYGKKRDLTYPGSVSITGTSSQQRWESEVKRSSRQVAAITGGVAGITTAGFIGSYIKPEDPWWKKLLIGAGAVGGGFLAGQLVAQATAQGVRTYKQRQDNEQTDQEIVLTTDRLPVDESGCKLFDTASPYPLLTQSSITQVYDSLGIPMYMSSSLGRSSIGSMPTVSEFSFFQPIDLDEDDMDGGMRVPIVPSTLPFDPEQWNNYKTDARYVFGTSISFSDLFTCFICNKILPDRVAGHDEDRNNDCLGAQKGKGASSDKHAENQAKQWTQWRDRSLSNVGRHKIADCQQLYKKMNNMDREQKAQQETTVRSGKDKSLRHNPEQQRAAAATKIQRKTERKQNKKKEYQEKQAASGTPSYRFK